MPVELTVLSKFKINQGLTNEQTLKVFKTRFGNTIPMECVDLVLVHCLNESSRLETAQTKKTDERMESEMRSTVHSSMPKK